MNSLTSKLLIASPELQNDFFSRSVVFVLEHSEGKGATGVVLNKPSNVPLEKMMPELDETPAGDVNELVNIGGPCTGPVLALHSCTECSELSLLPGVAMVVKPNNLERLLRSQSSVRMFSGYSGWAPGQLEDEIRSGGWYATDASSSLIFSDPSELWQQACEQYGNGIISDVVGDLIPCSPMLN